MKRKRRDGFLSDDHVLECSGREVYAHAGIFGIDEFGSVFLDYRELWAGEAYGPPDEPPLTDAERREVAEEMVARWRKWGKLND